MEGNPISHVCLVVLMLRTSGTSHCPRILRLMKTDLPEDFGLEKSNGPTTNALARVQRSSLSRKIIGSQSIDVA